MATSLPYNSISQSNDSLKSEHWQQSGFAETSALLNVSESAQQSRLDEESLQEWRMRLKQIRERR
jgi:hypothetical protein